MENLTIDLATLTMHANDPMIIGEHECRRDEVIVTLARRLDSVPELVLQTRRVSLGVYRGLRFGIVIHSQYAPEIYLEGATVRHATLSREHHGPRAVLNAVERLASDTDAQRIAARNELVLAEGQLRDYQARIGKPFRHEEYQAELTGLRDRLKFALSVTTSPAEPPTEPVTTPQELAELIRALKDSHTLDSPPQAPRLSNRNATAERPVTSRIRRREQVVPVEEPQPVEEVEASREEAVSPEEAPPQILPITEIIRLSTTSRPEPPPEVKGRAKQMQLFGN